MTELRMLRAEQIDNMREFLNSEQFYELAQRYRHAPFVDQDYVIVAFEALKAAILAELDRTR